MVDKLGPYELNTIVTGDARELAEAIPDESIDLIFTDPVYDRIEDYEWLAETAARVLKPNCSVLAFVPHVFYDAAYMLQSSGLQMNPLLEYGLIPPYGRMFKYSLQMNCIPCLWASKGNPKAKWQMLKFHSNTEGNRFHKWGKQISMIRYRISKFTSPGELIFDPFCGGGTIPAACKMLNRNYLAFEIDPHTAALARQRVAQTQPPLPIKMPEQLSLAEL